MKNITENYRDLVKKTFKFLYRIKMYKKEKASIAHFKGKNNINKTVHYVIFIYKIHAGMYKYAF